jgi:hypothetical protein
VIYSQIAIFGVCVVASDVVETILLSVYGVVNNVEASSTTTYVLVDPRSDAYVHVIVCVIVVGVGTVSSNLSVSTISLLSPGKSALYVSTNGSVDHRDVGTTQSTYDALIKSNPTPPSISEKFRVYAGASPLFVT